MITGSRVFWLLIFAMWALAALCFIAALSEADAAPVEVFVDQQTNAYRNTGWIVLRDPVTDEVIGTYEFVSGGFGRGSAPFGEYEIGAFRKDGWIGPRWEIHQIGIEPGDEGRSAYDPRISDVRTWLQIHTMHGFGHINGTLGCIGIRRDYEQFRRQLDYILSRGPVQFLYGPFVDARLG